MQTLDLSAFPHSLPAPDASWAWSCSSEVTAAGTRPRCSPAVMDDCCDGRSASLNRERGWVAAVLLEPSGPSSEEAEWRGCSHTAEDKSPEGSVPDGLPLTGTQGLFDSVFSTLYICDWSSAVPGVSVHHVSSSTPKAIVAGFFILFYFIFIFLGNRRKSLFTSK